MRNLTADIDRFQCGGQTDERYSRLEDEFKRALARIRGLNTITTFVPRCWNCHAELDPKRSWLEMTTRTDEHNPDGGRTSAGVNCTNCDEHTIITPLRHKSGEITTPRIYIREERE